MSRTQDSGASSAAQHGAAALHMARYNTLKRAIRGLPLPLCVLDMDALERNARALLARAGALPIRLCSKSIRSVAVLKHVQAMSPRFQGVLCYSAREAAWLATRGFDDLLVAYPVVDRAELDAACGALKRGVRLSLMVDDPAQLPAIAARAREHGVVVPLTIDLDLSSDYRVLYFGVRRSPVSSPEQAVALAQHIAQDSALRVAGLMGYEAQIAGPQDELPQAKLRSAVLRTLKRVSGAELRTRRQRTVRALAEAGFALLWVNGGGTGSLESTRSDASLSEVAAGSGLYAPTLFDHFHAFQHEPALYFALPVVRRPQPDIVTCAFGGYIASGPPGADRSPEPSLPRGLTLLEHEGAGEVQTPLRLPRGLVLGLGEPVFFRHAKAGELAERFTHMAAVRGDAYLDDLLTYRGEGQCFF